MMPIADVFNNITLTLQHFWQFSDVLNAFRYTQTWWEKIFDTVQNHKNKILIGT